MRRTKGYCNLVLAVLAGVACALSFGDDYRKGGSEHAGPLHWGYRSQNKSELMLPEAWGKVAPLCETGQTQSPVDIRLHRQAALAQVSLSAPVFNYTSVVMSVFHNRHTVQATDGSRQNTLTFNDKNYTLKNIHYHIKSEHLIDGEQMDFEVHMVHESAEGELMVLGILADFVSTPTPFGEGLVKMISAVKPRTSEFDPVDIRIDPARFLPKRKSFATYAGSLTTPPCKEGVRWIVFLETQGIGMGELEIIGAKKLKVGFLNFRPHFDVKPAQELKFSAETLNRPDKP